MLFVYNLVFPVNKYPHRQTLQYTAR